jgi:hypothetical protein
LTGAGDTAAPGHDEVGFLVGGFDGLCIYSCRPAIWYREAVLDGFTKTCGVKRLVWFETHEEIQSKAALE